MQIDSQSSKSIPVSEWLHIFPDAKNSYVLPKIRALSKIIVETENEVKSALNKASALEDGWFIREVIKAFEMPDLVQLKDELYRLKRYLPQSTKSSPKGVSEAEVQRAKDYPILGLAESNFFPLRQSGANHKGLCPFHEEKTPSFFVYPKANNFHCFGCNAHGDVIALAQKLLSCGFIEAVRHLTR